MLGWLWVAACEGGGPVQPSPVRDEPEAAEPAPSLTPLDQVEIDPEEVVEVQGSKMLLNPNDAIVSRVIRRDGIWEPLETKVFTRELRKGDIVVDVGANIGYYTLLAARLVGSTGHVYAFEPEPEAFALLERNVALNGYDNVTLVPKALGRESGTLQLFVAKRNRGDHRVYDPSGKRGAIDVPVVTLDEALAQWAPAHVDFLKVDTQGAECMILDGARQTIAEHPELQIVMELTPHFLAAVGDDPRVCLERLATAGYSFVDIREWERKLVPTDIDALLEAYPQGDRKKFTNLVLPRRGKPSSKVDGTQGKVDGTQGKVEAKAAVEGHSDARPAKQAPGVAP